MRTPLIITVIFFALATNANAQTVHNFSIKGKTLDSSQTKPLAYATLTLLNEKAEPVASSYSNDAGAFEIHYTKEGKYALEATAVGYTLYRTIITLVKGQYQISLPDLVMSPAVNHLQNVTVTARKRLVEQRPGMLVYNAENDLTNKGGTATDVLRKTPILSVDAQGNVSMRGNGNLKILINGKYSGQVARNPADALNMIPSEMIKSVEVITTPSAKYDAEGAAGVINIITKRSQKSLDGSLELVASNMEQAFNPRISLATGKWNLSFNGHLHNKREKTTIVTDRTQFDNGQPSLKLNQETRSDNYSPHGSQDFSAVYKADAQTDISFGVHTWLGNWPENKNIDVTTATADGTQTDSYSQTSRSKDKYLGNDFNTSLTRKFRRAGQELNLLLQFSPSKSSAPYNVAQTGKDATPRYKEQNDNDTRNREWTGQVDYQQPVSKDGRFSVEGGAKIILRRVSSFYDVFASGQSVDDLEKIPSRSDHFTYHQNVWAGYAMMKANLKNNWYAEAGLRYEKTDIEGQQVDAGSRFTSNFSNLIPTATVSKKITGDQTLSASYTKRLTRPYIWDLSPNIDASDPRNIVTGNPNLKPEMASQAELSYGFNKSTNFFVNASIFYKQTDNAIIEFSQIDTSGATITRKQNLSSNKTYGVNVSSSATLTDKWSVNGNLNVNYLDFSSSALQILREGWATEIGINTTVKLENGFSCQAFGNYSTRTVILQGYLTSRYYYSFAIKKSIPSSHITATLSTVNPFGSYQSQREYVETSSFTDHNINRYYNRAIRLSMTWDFGHTQTIKRAKKADNSDINDASRK